MGGKWKVSDVLPINGNEEEVEALREALLLSRAAVKAAKASKRAARDCAAPKAAIASRTAEPAASGPGASMPSVPLPDSAQLKRALEVRGSSVWLSMPELFARICCVRMGQH